ncbi:DUF423 domain-containing protein [Wenzhouxiangella sediminis]|uniref:DUF423 domain-containing protein n=1 Tax=Wenzhouxiangella sediminis TaxID=1792836 RepID=A0A3E1K654_9GAMM|nr:DUF423 domain-containing protein [Wenzhouxiangella sediminis]RFF29144.1 DUF423 domain-containing protein [Wenzhouxiangella sediminis]
MHVSLFTGAILGLLAVVAGAATGHGPVAGLDEESMRSLMTAVRYHEFGAVMIVATGLAAALADSGRAAFRLGLSSWLFVAGTLLFSFSIYARLLLGLDWLSPVTPLGGMCHMVGWIALGWAALSGMTRGSSPPEG